MKCKECKYFEMIECKYYELIDDVRGLCNNPNNLAPFLVVHKNDMCILAKTKLRCRNCKYWAKIEDTDDFGACTYGGYFPTFTDEPCMLKDEYLKQVEKENKIGDVI